MPGRENLYLILQNILLLSNECHVIQKVAEIHAVRLSLLNFMHDACGRHAIISWLVSLFCFDVWVLAK